MGAPLGLGQLSGPAMELKGHFPALVRRASKPLQHGGDGVDGVGFHGRKNGGQVVPDRRQESRKTGAYFTVSRSTIFTLSTPWRVAGRSWNPVLVVANFSNTSSPLMSLPKAVY